MSGIQPKLTKKQIKALEFKSKKSEKAAKELETVNQRKEEITKAIEDVKPKKRKTRRGKKGKGNRENSGPRFILFVGNLPYSISADEIKAHFKAANPDNVRLRQDKGIAFLEFNNERVDIQAKIDIALKLHHTILHNRKINVELTAGGGGNSSDRLVKIKEKNEKLLEERKTRISKEEEKQREKKLKNAQEQAVIPTEGGIHPSRLAQIEK